MLLCLQVAGSVVLYRQGTGREEANRKAMGSEKASFGERLRGLRETAGLSRDELASRSGLSAKAIGALERGDRRRPHPHTFGALADALGLTEEARTELFSTIPGRSTADPEAIPSGVEARSLPHSPTPLVGRSSEIGAARKLLLKEGARLVTLVGPGGVGKTRLALDIAREVAGSFPDGVVFVALAPLDEPGLVVSEIAGALGVKEAQGRSARDALYASLRDRRVLLVLDNFEHLTEAATEVTALLASCASVGVLVTSREALGVRGERRFPVPPLDVPDLSRLPAPEEVAGAEAAQLFVERAREISSGFELTRKNAAAVAAICRRLDGLPLAIELAAGLVTVLPPREILARLDPALPLLVGGPRDLPERQRTMRSAIAWSHDLLDDEEKVAFRRFAVFSGGFMLHAAEAILRPEKGATHDRTALEILSSLLDKSLLVAATQDDEVARFGMLETIRAYGLEQLAASGEEERVRARHARFYLELAEEAEPHLSDVERGLWLRPLEAEHDNLRAALSWSISEGRAEVALRLAGALFWFWFHGGHWSEGRTWLERALEAETAGRSDAPAARAKVLRGVGALACLQGDYAAASPLLEESVALWRELGDDWELAYALLFLDSTSLGLGKVEKARTSIEESVSLFRGADDAWGLSASLASLGVVFRAQQDRAAARSALEESAGIARELEDDFLLSLSMTNLGGVALEQGDYDRAEAYLKESFTLLSRQPGEEWFLAQSMDMLATIAAGRGDHARAARLYGAAEALREAAGSTVRPYYTSGHEQGVATAREALGEEGFAAAWAEGRTMTPRQRIAEALGHDARGPSEASSFVE